MNVHISASIVAQALDVSELTEDEVAQLIGASNSAPVIGIFPVGLHFTSERWVHLLCGDCVKDVDSPQLVEVLKFASSTMSFRAKQVLRRRQEEKDAAVRPVKCCPNCGHRMSAAAE